MVHSGLDRLENGDIENIKGKVGYLCHGASVNCQLKHGIQVLKRLFGDRLTTLFTPQHGLTGDVQDNMIESGHFAHPYFNLPVYSLYSETRIPTADMLKDIDSLIIDLQDVGTRVYTYIWTLVNCMKACGENDVKVVVLDRPNPIDASTVEGNVLDPAFSSFVGLHPIPMRHGLTAGEVARMASRFWQVECDLEVIIMQGYGREMTFTETGLPWVIPSPNLPFPDTAFVYPGSVLFEGTSVSEGRGTTHSLEILGHPNIEPFAFCQHLEEIFRQEGLDGFKLRPTVYIPTFHKFRGENCGGFQVHVTDPDSFRPWLLGQLLCREFYHQLGEDFRWKEPPYEYEYEMMPIDILNGTDKIRKWVEENGTVEKLLAIEREDQQEYLDQRDAILLY